MSALLYLFIFRFHVFPQRPLEKPSVFLVHGHSPYHSTICRNRLPAVIPPSYVVALLIAFGE